jgi:hypothetical protein
LQEIVCKTRFLPFLMVEQLTQHCSSAFTNNIFSWIGLVRSTLRDKSLFKWDLPTKKESSKHHTLSGYR